MQHGLTRLTGHMFITPTRLLFLCGSTKGGLAVAIGKGVGGALGGLVASAGLKGVGPVGPMSEPEVLQLIGQQTGSLVMEPAGIRQIKDTFWTHAIWFDGKTYALPNGIPKDMKPALAQWCDANGVKHAGLVKTK
jgi:hypothetical protein